MANTTSEPDRGAETVLRIGRFTIGLITVCLIALTARVVQLQNAPSPKIVKMLDTQRGTDRLVGRRGDLLDRRGRPLATTREARRLFVDPVLIDDRASFSERLAYGLDYDPVWVEKTIASRGRSRYIVLDERLDDRRVVLLSELQLPGVATEPVMVRDYPHGQRAAHLLGFVGRNGAGLEGLERQFEEQLTPSRGSLRYLRDSSRRPLWVEEAGYEPHRDGEAVYLSLDVHIQAIAEHALSEAIDRYGARGGQLVVMDPLTGEILAMANHPPFDPADFAATDAAARRNRAVTDVFEPGSIFKPFVWAALIESGAVHPNERLDCTESGVWLTPYGRRLRDDHGKGELSFDQVLIESSNIGMAIAAERIEPARLHEIVTAFGFGSPTGSGLAGEIGGLVHPLEKWTRYSQSSIPMGQEIGVTALQMLRAFSALANDGLLIRPTIERVEPDPEARVIRQRVLSAAVAIHARRVLHRTVKEGTGRKANSPLYEIFGKTGTAQLPNLAGGGYHQDRYLSSFIAGAPVTSPRLVVGCFIQDPDRRIAHYGGTVAAPAVRDVIEKALVYLGVPPKSPRVVRVGEPLNE